MKAIKEMAELTKLFELIKNQRSLSITRAMLTVNEVACRSVVEDQKASMTIRILGFPIIYRVWEIKSLREKEEELAKAEFAVKTFEVITGIVTTKAVREKRRSTEAE